MRIPVLVRGTVDVDCNGGFVVKVNSGEIESCSVDAFSCTSCCTVVRPETGSVPVAMSEWSTVERLNATVWLEVFFSVLVEKSLSVKLNRGATVLMVSFEKYTMVVKLSKLAETAVT